MLAAATSTYGMVMSTPNENLQLPVGKVNIIVNVAITWIILYSKM
jgi:hypothetical protein